jgi:hypothetical protein
MGILANALARIRAAAQFKRWAEILVSSQSEWKGSLKMINRVADVEPVDSDYMGLYRSGGAAAYVVVVITLGVLIVFTVYPQPSTVSAWFELFQSNKVIGLLDFWCLEVVMYMMFALVFLSLYIALREANQGRMAIAFTFSLLGVGIFLATNNPFTMLSLSNQYTIATTDAQRTTLLAAGQAVLANTGQRVVGGFNVGLFLVSVAGLLVSSVMLQSTSFNKSMAYVGILAWSLSLVDYLRQILTQSALIALLVIIPNAMMIFVWFAMVGRRLNKLGRPDGEKPRRQA